MKEINEGRDINYEMSEQMDTRGDSGAFAALQHW